MNIKINHIKKIYNQKTVLSIDNQELLFRTGQINGIIGPNGSGKSTLVRIIAGLSKASEGQVLYDDAPFSDTIQPRMTYSGQHSFLLSKSVEDNIAYPLKIRRFPKAEQQKIVEERLNELQLESIRHQNGKKLSGGEAQKTALARALSFSPELLLLDEPTASIDPQSIKTIEASLLKRKKDTSLNTIIITHNLSQAFRICDTLTFIYQGKILFSGVPQDLMNESNDVIQEFISFN